MAAPSSVDEVKRANVRYHDLAAAAYDAKWGIGYGEGAQEQVVAKLRGAAEPVTEAGDLLLQSLRRRCRRVISP